MLRWMLLVGVLFLLTWWTLDHRPGPMLLASVLVAIPIVYGLHVFRRCVRLLNETTVGMRVRITLSGAALSEHALFRAAHEAADHVYETMKNEDRADQYGRLLAAGVGVTFEFILKQGLVWRDATKTFAQRIRVQGRILGEVLGDAAIEPSLMIIEESGVLAVLLAPVCHDRAGYVVMGSDRAASEHRAESIYKEELSPFARMLGRTPHYEIDSFREGPRPAVLGELPIADALQLLATVPDPTLTRRWRALLKFYGCEGSFDTKYVCFSVSRVN